MGGADRVTHVRVTVQPAPGEPRQEMRMPVHRAPTDLPIRAADEVELSEDACDSIEAPGRTLLAVFPPLGSI